jgi:hypothetical protein
MIRTATLAIAMTAMLFILPSDGSANADLQEEVEFVGFSKKEKVFCVRVIDPNRGNYFSVRKTRTGKKIKDHPYHEDNEKRVLKRLLKAHSIDDEGVPNAASPDGSVTLVGTQKGAQFEILALASDGRGVLQTIELETDADTGNPAQASLKSVIWSSNGKVVVLIVHQALSGSFIAKRDHVFVQRYRAWKVQWQ